MARTKNENGTRQMALRALDNMQHLKRDEMLDLLREQFPDAAEEYRKTLWATWRREAKASGALVEVFSIRDMRDGKSVKPYLKTEWIFRPDSDACFNVELAKNQYEFDLKNKISQANQLKRLTPD